MCAMDANAYADEIERRFPDRDALGEIRDQLEADPELDAYEKRALSDRVGTYLYDMDRSGLEPDESPTGNV